MSSVTNNYPYAGSPVAESSVAQEYSEDALRFHNGKDPNFAILHERPEHRIVIMLKGQGKSNRDIYRALGGTFDPATGKALDNGRYSQSWISQILRQPWARKAVLEEIRRNTNGDGFQQLMASEVENSFFTLVELRDSAKDDPGVRRGCANDILDRVFGKPTQHVHAETKVEHSLNDINAIEQDIAATEAELKRLGAVPPTVETLTNK